MQDDDFDDEGILLPEDDLAGDSDLSDLGEGLEEIDIIEAVVVQPAGRSGGGSRARSRSESGTPAPQAPLAPAPPVKNVKKVKKTSKPAKKGETR